MYSIYIRHWKLKCFYKGEIVRNLWLVMGRAFADENRPCILIWDVFILLSNLIVYIVSEQSERICCWCFRPSRRQAVWMNDGPARVNDKLRYEWTNTVSEWIPFGLEAWHRPYVSYWGLGIAQCYSHFIYKMWANSRMLAVGHADALWPGTLNDGRRPCISFAY